MNGLLEQGSRSEFKDCVLGWLNAPPAVGRSFTVFMQRDREPSVRMTLKVIGHDKEDDRFVCEETTTPSVLNGTQGTLFKLDYKEWRAVRNGDFLSYVFCDDWI